MEEHLLDGMSLRIFPGSTIIQMVSLVPMGLALVPMGLATFERLFDMRAFTGIVALAGPVSAIVRYTTVYGKTKDMFVTSYDDAVAIAALLAPRILPADQRFVAVGQAGAVDHTYAWSSDPATKTIASMSLAVPAMEVTDYPSVAIARNRWSDLVPAAA